MKTWDEEVRDTLREFPDFKLVAKSTSRFMRLLDVLLRVVSFGQMRTFMTHFTTTIGYTIYTPPAWANWDDFQITSILRHERVHMRQSRDMGSLKFKLYYLLWFFPVGLAKGRTKIEMEAYEETIRTRVEYGGLSALTREYRENMIRHFTSAEYIWMWPFRKSVEAWYDGFVEEITNEMQGND